MVTVTTPVSSFGYVLGAEAFDRKPLPFTETGFVTVTLTNCSRFGLLQEGKPSDMGQDGLSRITH